MWRSEKDFIKDIATLNDFGNSYDEELYEAFCLKKKEEKLKEKSNCSTPFIDYKTGEVVEINDDKSSLNELTHISGRGRGSALGNLVKGEFQLQKQLRMAKPQGSNDSGIESYYKWSAPGTSKQFPTENNQKESCLMEKTENSNFSEPWPKVKAVRNSKLQSNALLTSLLSKEENISECNINNTDTKIQSDMNRCAAEERSDSFTWNFKKNSEYPIQISESYESQNVITNPIGSSNQTVSYKSDVEKFIFFRGQDDSDECDTKVSENY